MKTKFDELIAQVKPLFKDNGFTKNGLNFAVARWVKI